MQSAFQYQLQECKKCLMLRRSSGVPLVFIALCDCPSGRRSAESLHLQTDCRRNTSLLLRHCPASAPRGTWSRRGLKDTHMLISHVHICRVLSRFDDPFSSWILIKVISEIWPVIRSSLSKLGNCCFWKVCALLHDGKIVIFEGKKMAKSRLGSGESTRIGESNQTNRLIETRSVNSIAVASCKYINILQGMCALWHDRKIVILNVMLCKNSKKYQWVIWELKESSQIGELSQMIWIPGTRRNFHRLCERRPTTGSSVI